MEGIKVDYVVLLTLLYILFWLYGKKVSKFSLKSGFSNYWVPLIIPITLYSLIEGLRYERGHDYINYLDIYNSSTNLNSTGQPVFDLLNYGLNLLNIPYNGALIIYSFIFIVCAFVFLKEYREISLYSFPCFLTATLLNSETFIRQFLSFSFVFLAIKSILSDKWMKFFLFSIVTLLIHTANIFLLVFIFIQRTYTKPINRYVAIVIYLFLAYLFNAANISIIIPYIEKLHLGEHFGSYVQNANSWLSKNAIKDIYKQDLSAKIANTLFDVSIIFLGYEVIKKNFLKYKSLVMFYNVFILGAWLLQAFFEIELMRRFALILYLFWFILAGYIFYLFPITSKNKLFIKVCSLVILIYIILFTFKNILLPKDQLFIWDI